MVRVVGKEGALGAGVGGNCSSGMDGFETIARRYPGVPRLVWFVCVLFGRGIPSLQSDWSLSRDHGLDYAR